MDSLLDYVVECLMGRKVKDITGQKFGLLTALHIDPECRRGDGFDVKWICSCECGGMTSATSQNLKFGSVKGCGCLVGRKRKYATPEESKKAAVARALAWNRANPARHSEHRSAHYWRYPERAKQVAYIYLGRKTKQTCACCSRKDFNEFYMACPAGHEVDHIVPISKGGAHCLDNLQYLTKHENRVKGARMAVV